MFFQNVLVSPKRGLLSIKNNKPIEQSFHYRGRGDLKVFNMLPIFNPPVFEIKDAYFAGFKFDHFGHFLLESLSRLYNVKASKTKNIVWVSPTNSIVFKPWQLEIFEILGLNNYNHIVVTEPTVVENIELYDQGYREWDLFNDKHNQFLSVYQSPPIIKNKKLWISRASVNGNWVNEPEIEQELIKNNWQIFHPEKYTVLEQLYQMLSSEIVAGIEGSGFHTLILSNNPKTKIIIFAKRATNYANGNIVNRNYLLISKVKKFNQREIYPEQYYVEEDGLSSRLLSNTQEVLNALNIESDLVFSFSMLGDYFKKMNSGNLKKEKGSELEISLDELGIRFNCDKSSKDRAKEASEKSRSGHNYLVKYEYFFKKLKKKANLNFLELGIGPDWNMGASLKIWLEYFNEPSQKIHVAEINNKAMSFSSDRVSIYIGDLGEQAFLNSLSKQNYDIILDDASHYWDHQISAFMTLFPSLSAGGIYICEDIHTSFGPKMREFYCNGTSLDAFEFLSVLSAYVVGRGLKENPCMLGATEVNTQAMQMLAKQIDTITFMGGSCLICKNGFYS